VKLVELKLLVGRHFQGLPESLPRANDLILETAVVGDFLHDLGVEFEASFPLGKNDQFWVQSHVEEDVFLVGILTVKRLYLLQLLEDQVYHELLQILNLDHPCCVWVILHPTFLELLDGLVVYPHLVFCGG